MIKINNKDTRMTSVNFEQILCKNPADSYFFNVNNGNTRAMGKICSKLTIKTPEKRQWCRFGVFVINFEQILHIVQEFPLLTLNK